MTTLLRARLPFAGHAVLDFLRARAIPGVEVVGTDTYERAAVRPLRVLRVRVRSDGLEVDGDRAGLEHARRLFDLDADGRVIDEHLARDAKMRALVKRTPGVRVPGAFDAFELGVRTVLGQQVSVAAATTLCARLTSRFGAPSAPVLAQVEAEEVAKIGLPLSRARTLVALACHAVAARPFTPAELVAIKGIGPWTAKYIAMRALADPDVFLEEDLVVRKAMKLMHPKDAAQRAQRWAPYRSYAVMRLWRGVIEEYTDKNGRPR